MHNNLLSKLKERLRSLIALSGIVALGLSQTLVLVPVNASTLFQDTFSGSSGLITDENAYWNGGSNSSAWEMTSGSLYNQNGAAWTGTNDDVFRANTKQKFSAPIRVSMSLKQNKDIHDSNCNSGDTCWYGTHIWLGYQTQYNLYYASVNRADGEVVIKRKVPCGDDNSGTYFVLGSAKHDWKAGQWDHYSATLENNSDGSVTIKMYDDDQSKTTPIVQGTDRGGTNPNWSSSCSTEGKYPSAKYTPITAAGAVGVRGDYSDFNFDDFTVVSGTSSSGSTAPTQATTPTQTQTPTPAPAPVVNPTPVSNSPTQSGSSDNSLVGMWKLDGNTTASAGSNAAAKGNVSYVSGKLGQAASFNGSDYVEIPDSNQLSPSASGEKMTVAFWMNPANFNFAGQNEGYVNLLGKGQSSQQEWTFRLYNSTAQDGGSRAKRMSFYAFNLSGGQGAGSYFQDDLQPNQWIFVTGVIDGKNTKIYKNGQLRDTDPLSGYNINMGNGTAPVRIGTRDMDSYFQGAIDNVRIYNRALSDSEIQQLYQNDLNGTSASAPTSNTTVTSAPVVNTNPTPTPVVNPTPAPKPTNSLPVTSGTSAGSSQSSGSVLPIKTPSLTTASVQTTPGITATWVKTEEYGTDYCGKVTIKNTGSKPVTSWKVNMPVTGRVTDLWNAKATQTGSAVNMTSLSWNGQLNPGQTYTGIGFCALYNK